MGLTWKAKDTDFEFLSGIKNQYHGRLKDAEFCLAFSEAKPFVKNKLNLGKVQKFSAFNKMWQSHQYDFCITLSHDLWTEILNPHQRQAIVDLHLTRCTPEYLPEYIEENGKKKPVKDEWGRIKYSNEVKLDKDGLVKWRIDPLDLEVISHNIRRFGLWCESFDEAKEAFATAKSMLGDQNV